MQLFFLLRMVQGGWVTVHREHCLLRHLEENYEAHDWNHTASVFRSHSLTRGNGSVAKSTRRQRHNDGR
jgi:hypothetical protein